MPVDPTYPPTTNHADVKGKLDAVIGLVNTTPRVESGAFTLQASDENDVVNYTGAGAADVTVPSSLPMGYYNILQKAAGVVTVVAGANAQVVSEPDGGPKSRGQWSVITVYVHENIGGNAARAVVIGGVA